MSDIGSSGRIVISGMQGRSNSTSTTTEFAVTACNDTGFTSFGGSAVSAMASSGANMHAFCARHVRSGSVFLVTGM
ncbi:MAG: hypothetical protein JST54_21830 [Deltaproteobacteria bacterium]|nr:hypothetical protein [Deltaproteobacteria bacterium]